jgi:hypothetical protein
MIYILQIFKSSDRWRRVRALLDQARESNKSNTRIPNPLLAHLVCGSPTVWPEFLAGPSACRRLIELGGYQKQHV